MLILTNQSWVLVVALDSKLISSVHGDCFKSSRYCHGPRLVVPSPPRVPSCLSSSWSPGFLFGHLLLVCPCSWQEKHCPSSRYSCFSSYERYHSLLVWFFFGHLLLICPCPWQQKHRPSLRCCCLSSPVRCCAHPVVVPVAILVGQEGCLDYSLLLPFILFFISVFFVPSLVLVFSGGLSALSVGH